MMRHYIFMVFFLLCMSVQAQENHYVSYGYAPEQVAEEERAYLGLDNMNGLISAALCLDPAKDAVVRRLKGQSVIGLRVQMHHAYKNGKEQRRSLVRVALDTPDNTVMEQVCNFQEGQNDIIFDSPVTIGDGKLFVGVQVYETLGASHPFMAFGKASVEGACWIKLKDKEWQNFTDRGTLCIKALFNEDVAAQIVPTVYVQNTTHPQKVAPETDFNGGLYIMNQSGMALTSVEIAMQGEGDDAATLRTIDLPSELPAGHATVVQAQLRAGKKEGTEAALAIWATKANGAEMLEGRKGITHLVVSSDDFIRVPLVEEFTSQYCVNCPFMVYYLDKAMEMYREEGKQVIYLTRHTGYKDDFFTCPADKAIDFLNENFGNPAVMYNRTVFEGMDHVYFGAQVAETTPYTECLNTAGSQFALAKVEVLPVRTGNGVGVTVRGRVARDFIDRDVYLSVYLVEDSIPTTNYPQMGLDVEGAPSDLKENYRHNGIIRATYNLTDQGDLIEVDGNGNFEVRYEAVELKTDPTVEPKKYWTEKNMRAVAVVHRYNTADIRDNYVLNAAEARWQTTDIMTVFHDLSQEKRIYNLAGQRLNRLQKGIMIVNGKKVVVR